MISLSYIIDEIYDMSTDLSWLMVDKGFNKKNITTGITKLINNPNSFVDRRLKDFYKKYQEQFINISNHINIETFIDSMFDDRGSLNSNFKQMHSYIMEHRDEAYKILDVLFAIESLGIKEIIYDESYDPNKRIYSMNKNINYNKSFYYLDNITILPSYEDSIIKYNSKTSSYEIRVPLNGSDEAPIIRVNNLVFNPSRLPRNLYKETVLEPITKYEGNIQEQNKLIRDSVDFSSGISDLDKAYYELYNRTANMRFDNRAELIESLNTIKKGIQRLKELSKNYDSQIIDSNENISDFLLEKEKEATKSIKRY